MEEGGEKERVKEDEGCVEKERERKLGMGAREIEGEGFTVSGVGL